MHNAKGTWQEYRIELVGKRRHDGSLFVTSTNMAPFSAVLPDDNWEDVLGFLRQFLEANFGHVKNLRLIRDAAELVGNHIDLQNIPPAYVVAELTRERAHAS